MTIGHDRASDQDSVETPEERLWETKRRFPHLFMGAPAHNIVIASGWMQSFEMLCEELDAAILPGLKSDIYFVRAMAVNGEFDITLSQTSPELLEMIDFFRQEVSMFCEDCGEAAERLANRSGEVLCAKCGFDQLLEAMLAEAWAVRARSNGNVLLQDVPSALAKFLKSWLDKHCPSLIVHGGSYGAVTPELYWHWLSLVRDATAKARSWWV